MSIGRRAQDPSSLDLLSPMQLRQESRNCGMVGMQTGKVMGWSPANLNQIWPDYPVPSGGVKFRLHQYAVAAIDMRDWYSPRIDRQSAGVLVAEPKAPVIIRPL
ncbi:hypothetical protein HOY82DRAFT_540394 [Tuber indicum]|nr:hypothetical protein HOY82DRAFT_540394 [Tuber indicum]